MYLKAGDTIALVACSNPLSVSIEDKIHALTHVLQKQFGLKTRLFCGIGEQSAAKRADYLHQAYLDSDVKMIFDISGGDLANELLPYLDSAILVNQPKSFVGYSDLSVLVNALYVCTGTANYCYNILNLIGTQQTLQYTYFKEAFMQVNQQQTLYVGGNIRCFLKLAGTRYWPNMQGKALLLESLSGSYERMCSAICHLEQLDVFKQVSAIVLGQFTQLQADACYDTFVAYCENKCREYGIICRVVTDLGHHHGARAYRIGK